MLTVSPPPVFELSDELKRLTALGMGAAILTGLVIIHGAGLLRILIHHKQIEAKLMACQASVEPSFLVGWSVLLMVFLHAIEISIWALVLYAFGLIKGFHNAVYFCANAYTTLGYGDVTLEKDWQNVGPMIAVSGMFCFAWTTGALAAIASALWRQIERKVADSTSIHNEDRC
jgi:Ion channel